MALANGTSATYVYDAAGNAARVANVRSDQSVISIFDYSYDAVGNRIGVVENNGDRVTWSYDALYQLTREQRSGASAYDITYTYDAVGNRLTEVAGGAITTHTYDAADELLTETARDSSVTTYSYDSNGNLVLVDAEGSLTTYAWDGEDRLVRLGPEEWGAAFFTYDADGLLRGKRAGIVSTRLLWDGQNVLRASYADGIGDVDYTWTPDVYGSLISRRHGDDSHFCHFAAPGSPPN